MHVNDIAEKAATTKRNSERDYNYSPTMHEFASQLAVKPDGDAFILSKAALTDAFFFTCPFV